MEKGWHGLMRGKPCSHPGKPLEYHLLHTREIAVAMAEHYKISLDDMEQAALLMHDLAKTHPAFQRRLCKACPAAPNCEQVCKQCPPDLVYTGHAAPSASLVFVYTQSVLLAEAIRRHHGALQDLDEVKNYWVNGDYIDRVKELEAIPTWQGAASLSLWDKIPTRWVEYLPDEEMWENLGFENVELGLDEENAEQMSQAWLDLRKVYSLLVAADRWDAAVGSDWNGALWTAQPQQIKTFLKKIQEESNKLGRAELAHWRSTLYEQVLSSARKKIVKPGLYTLTLPTGAGKTLIGLSIAAMAAERLNSTGIIYVLPFISLVDQNAAVARQLFTAVQEDHHLAYRESNKADKFSENRAQKDFLSFFRYWDAPVVVTTLSKLWEVLYSPRANDSMNFHRLSHSVIVLDEPQSIPAKYWEGLGKTLELISQQWETSFILMTATQPAIVKGTELVDEPVYFPKERHHIQYVDNPQPVDDLPQFLDEKGWLKKDSLVILNTRESALKTFLAARERKLPAYLLSRWLTPADRFQIMQQLQDMENRGKQRCLISTQVVEAGVDLDFSLVFRDLAPFDSIIQAAGRCNRHAQNSHLGEVWVRELKDERNRSLCSYVYEKTLINQTRILLTECQRLSEREVPKWVAEYYRRLSQSVSQDEIWPDICKGRWGSYRNLYEQEVPETALLINSEGNLYKYIEELQQLSPSYNNLAQRREINRLLGQYTINVAVKYLEEWEMRTTGFLINEDKPMLEEVSPFLWVLHPEGIGKIYSPSFGFMPPKYYHQAQEIGLLENEGEF